MKITQQVQYLNNHLNDNDEKIINWLNNYLHTSYTYSKQNMDKSWLYIQPGFPDKKVESYRIVSNPWDYSFGHKTNRIIIICTDHTEIDISLYKFKRFIKTYGYVSIY